MHLTTKGLKKIVGRVKANMIVGVVTTITCHSSRDRITVKCVELNKRTPTGRNKRVFKVLDARHTG